MIRKMSQFIIKNNLNELIFMYKSIKKLLKVTFFNKILQNVSKYYKNSITVTKKVLI